MENRISFIIIGKNESKNIGKCVESIRDLSYPSYEIIYIDSNSTDNTDEVLKAYEDVKSYKIISNIYTAALARDCGVDKSNGVYIVFLDGDMEIKADSDIKFCIDSLEESNIGIVSGELDNIWIENGKVINRVDNTFNVKSEVEELECPGGYFITKRQYYMDAKRFNRALKCNEEIDLFSRYKKINKIAIRTNKLCCLHKNYSDNKGKGHISRLKSGYYTDFWRVIISSLKNNYIEEYFSFKSQIIMIRSIVLTMIMIVLLGCSLINYMFILVPLAYYSLILLKNKFNIIVIKYNQLNNIMIILSLVFIFKKKNLHYKIDEI